MEPIYDVAIIGGGINGCGCAADAALRGLSVVLCEKGDLASQTSSKSSKLIHGGLRYLEHFEFSLVKKAIKERQRLLELAPHLVQPLAFLIPHQPHSRPLWMLRAGLFLYDHLSLSNQLPRSTLTDRQTQPLRFEELNPAIDKGLLFYDGTTNDARLTLVNALQAKENGALILTYTTLTKAEVIDGLWHLSLSDQYGKTLKLKSKTLINTTGPWVQHISHLLNIPMEYPIALIKGSHIVVPKLYSGDHAYLLQHPDKRIIFTIPYHGHTLIGTTDIPFNGDLDTVHIEEEEINYLCSVVNQFFKQKIHKKNIITSWSGVRPLLAETGKTPSTLSRDYTLHYSQTPAPAITVYGGKITTYRQLAEQTIDKLGVFFTGLPPSTTARTKLPGAATTTMDFKEYLDEALQRYHWIDEATLKRYLNTYGTLTDKILNGCNKHSDLGRCFMPTLFEKEVNYLIQQEWAKTPDDILWRRTMLGLNKDENAKHHLEIYIKEVSS